MITLSHVQKTFSLKGQQVHAVDDVSLQIHDGEIFGIVGYSGAGKSTLVRLLNQLEQVDSGLIEIDGVDITRLHGKTLRHFRQNIGMIFQNFNLLWSRTVRQNIEFPLEIAGWPLAKRKARCAELLNMVGLQDKADNYPSALSGGQKQRVAIARALALNPRYLLSDESTSALDPKTTKDILRLLQDINERYHITIIIITHQMEVVQSICHRLVVMANGRVIEEGDVKSVFQNPQHELTKKLLHSVDTGVDMEESSTLLRERFPEGYLLRITFDNDTSTEPILYRLAKKSDSPFSIISANLVNTHAGSLGVMYLHVDTKRDIHSFVAELQQYQLKVEVL